MTLNKLILILLLLSILAGCSSVPIKSSPNWVGYKQSGKASFYAMKFQFRKTASGERFNQCAMTAAHRNLPFGTKVRVTNIKNGKSVVVKINDRGPYVKGRIIDLSRVAFARIGRIDSGVLRVKIEVIN